MFCVKNRYTMSMVIQTLVVVVLVLQADARLIDISREVQTVVSVHNDERMNPALRAANMREMVWDSQLQRQAEQWANKCLYERPPTNAGFGANLHYQRHYVHGHASAHKLVKHSLNSWIKEKDNFVYSSHCGAACLYVQMIHTGSDRVGCAMNTCPDMKARLDVRVRGTLFVCLYSPQSLLLNTFPYLTGRPCSKCQSYERCIGGYLCSKDEKLGELVLRPPTTKEPLRERPQGDDSMTNIEMQAMLEIHNGFRRERDLKPLFWDRYLERYCKYVINCTIDYPGPRHAYSNFHRMSYNTPTTNVVFDWKENSDTMPPRTERKCRTPFDVEECNHYSNMMQPLVTGMACATKACSRDTRQLVCIYDDKRDRDYRLSQIRRVRRPRRRWDRRSRNRLI